MHIYAQKTWTVALLTNPQKPKPKSAEENQMIMPEVNKFLLPPDKEKNV